MLLDVRGLRALLESCKISPVHYALLEDGLPDEKLCLCKGDSGEWSVYYSERGKKRGLVRFASEQEACCYLWEKLKRYAGNG